MLLLNFLDRYLYLKLTSDLGKLMDDGILDDEELKEIDNILKEFNSKNLIYIIIEEILK